MGSTTKLACMVSRLAIMKSDAENMSEVVTAFKTTAPDNFILDRIADDVDALKAAIDDLGHDTSKLLFRVDA